MGSKTTINQPPPIDPGKAMGEYLFGSDFGKAQGITDPMLQQRLIDAEATFRPQYRALELAEQEASLFGTEDQAGLIELQKRASEEFAPIEKAAKEREVAMLGEMGGKVTEALRAADPSSTRLADLQAKQAETLYAEAEGRLSPERARMAEQAARAGGAARGRLGDAGTLANELLGRDKKLGKPGRWDLLKVELLVVIHHSSYLVDHHSLHRWVHNFMDKHIS
jgi:hypothetical protein